MHYLGKISQTILVKPCNNSYGSRNQTRVWGTHIRTCFKNKDPFSSLPWEILSGLRSSASSSFFTLEISEKKVIDRHNLLKYNQSGVLTQHPFNTNGHTAVQTIWPSRGEREFCLF
jgi:hypothetical protein